MPTGNMSKQPALAAARRDAEKKTATKKAPKAKVPAKLKAAKPAKAAKAPKTSKPSKTTLTVKVPEILAPAELALRAEEADRILLDEIPKELASLEGGKVALHAKVQDAIERELWQKCSTPFKSWSAYVKFMQEKAGKSIATLFSAVGLLKALPGESPASRAAIPARAGQKIKQHAKQKKAKGDKKPISKKVVDAAKSGNPKKLDEALKAEGFKEPKGRKKADKPDPLLVNKDADGGTSGLSGWGASGAVEGQEATAGQYSSVVEQAIEVACRIYGLANKAEGLKRVCGEWLNSPTLSPLPELADLSNLEAFEKLKAGD